MPRITVALLVTTIAVYVAGNPLWLALWPIPSYEFRPWQLVTYAFLHGNLLHLVVNLLALVSFGPALERAWGRQKFIACYAFAAAFGGGLQAVMSDGRPVIGASAALFGLFAAYVIDRPKARIVTLLPWALPAWVVLVAYAVLSVCALAFGWMTQVSHIAHLGGVVVGVAFAANNKPRV